MTAICEGLNVLEIGSSSIAASMTAMVFADAGARVIKVERPQGDRLRTQNPNGFKVWNRGKESLVADLRTPAGQARFQQLAAAADVVVEGFQPGTTDGWGIGPGALRQLNPRLVHCSITGFGRTGPYAALKGYDPLVAAKAGLWGRGAFGHRDGAIMFPVPWGSFGASMQAVAGILGALRVRDLTGRGQELDATLWAGMEPLDYFVSTIVQCMMKRGQAAPTDARASLAASRYGVLVVTRDGRFLQTSTLLPHQGKALCDVAGIGHVLDEPRFSRLPMFDTADDAQAWEDLLLDAFRQKDLDHWLPRLLASPDIAFEVAVTSEEGVAHPQIVHNGDVITVDDPDVGPIRQVGPVAHLSRSPIGPTASAPALDAHGGELVASAPTMANVDGTAPAHPFAGVTIVEFGYFYAMPYGVAMAASLGARVIKIEDGKGDPHRMSFGEELASNKTTAAKESISLDLRSPEGRAIAQQIVARADVFITGFRTGVPEKLGLGEAELRALNPRLVYVHAAGYGTDGPYAHRALYAQAAQAVAGSFGRQVGYWSAPEQNIDLNVPEMQAIVLPRLAQVVDGDSNASLAVLASLALAIYHQHRTGEGQFVRTSMIAGNALAYSDDFCLYDGKVPVPLTDDDYFGLSAMERVYPAGDGTWVCLVVQTDEEFAALAGQIGGSMTDDRFASSEGRAAHDAELISLLSATFESRPALEWEARLSAAGVGCVEANVKGQPAVTCFDPVLRQTGLTVTFDHPMFGEMVRAAPPVSFSETPGRVAPPCLRGEHNRAILADLGYSAEQISALESSGVITPSKRDAG